MEMEIIKGRLWVSCRLYNRIEIARNFNEKGFSKRVITQAQCVLRSMSITVIDFRLT